MKRNTKLDKANSYRLSQEVLRNRALLKGVNLIAPETIFLSSDTSFGKNVTVEPYVIFGPKVKVGDNSCIVRELHVYGKSLKIGEKEESEIQHSGLGKNLMKEAEKISKEEFDARKLLVISAVGTREYYQKLGYSLYGPYMSKTLD